MEIKFSLALIIDLIHHTLYFEPISENYDEFINLIWAAAKKNILRGCRTEYIPRLTNESSLQYKHYVKLFNSDPFGEETIETGNLLTSSIGDDEDRKDDKRGESVNFTHMSKKAWSTFDKVNASSTPAQGVAAVTPNQVACQLIKNGKPTTKASHQTKMMK